MKIQHPILISGLILAATTFSTSESWGQADPAWLKSWNRAQELRPATLATRGRIASEEESGPPMIIRGMIFGPDGTPAARVVVHAYQRDGDGFEFGPNDDSLSTWDLQGWVQTDANGRFEFQTIRPAPDHIGREGAHIHFTLESKDYGRQWAPKIFFSDDPLVTPTQRRRSKQAGEYGWVCDVETVDGVQHADVKIQLKEKADF